MKQASRIALILTSLSALSSPTNSKIARSRWATALSRPCSPSPTQREPTQIANFWKAADWCVLRGRAEAPYKRRILWDFPGAAARTTARVCQPLAAQRARGVLSGGAEQCRAVDPILTTQRCKLRCWLRFRRSA